MTVSWATVASTFILVFVAELGDKTQLAVIAQTCKHRRPWAVFLGASLALTAVTALGVVGGEVVARLVPPLIVRLAAAASFLVMGIWIGREALQQDKHASRESGCSVLADEVLDDLAGAHREWRAFATTLGLLFVAELGDKTQLAVLTLAGRNAARGSVFLGGALALVAVTALGVLGGEGLSRRVPQRQLLKLSALAFIVMGVLLGVGAF